ncbi:MAG TPA: CDP-alcohol phosphatidyltransferase family protein [Gaiellaceae bacterium]|nr:CDP-alcohol phosphatidyltransferase family protein [Gaiellaceae bacterium]
MPGSALPRIKHASGREARRLAGASLDGLARTPVTPNVLTAVGVTLSIAGAVLVYFEYVTEWLFLLGGFVFLVGSLLDIVDGALARSRALGTPFGAFIDSTVDRVGEAFMLGAIALVFMRAENEVAVGLAFAALAGSFLVSYTRARAEALGLSGKVGIGTRAERVAVITTGLGLEALLPFSVLPWAIALLAATAWFTVVQRILFVRAQLHRR